MQQTKIDTLRIAITSKLKTTECDISDSFENSPYLLIIDVKKEIQNIQFINSKGQKVAGSYPEYINVKCFKIENKEEKDKTFIINKIIEQKAEILIANYIEISNYQRIKNSAISIYKSNGYLKDAVANFLENKLNQINI